MSNDNANIKDIIAALDATGIIAELAEAKGGITAAEAREAVEALVASDPGAGTAMRERFLAWDPARQESALEVLAGDDGAGRRTWSRLLFGIVEHADGTIGLAR